MWNPSKCHCVEQCLLCRECYQCKTVYNNEDNKRLKVAEVTTCIRGLACDGNHWCDKYGFNCMKAVSFRNVSMCKKRLLESEKMKKLIRTANTVEEEVFLSFQDFCKVMNTSVSEIMFTDCYGNVPPCICDEIVASMKPFCYK